MDPSQAKFTKEGLNVLHCYSYSTKDFIPAWESSPHILILTSDDDKQVDPKMSNAYQSAYPKNKRHLLEVVHYPGAGHLLEPPYTPHCRSCVNPYLGEDLMWGGTPSDHAAAQEDSWSRIQSFLRTHLS
ncbi:bile acid-CoA:amino acid N-acyltransferase-like isoform X2 [Babylonia areolata]